MKYYSAKKPDNNKNTTNPCNDMDESQKHYYKQDARYKQHELYNSTDLNARTAIMAAEFLNSIFLFTTILTLEFERNT